MTNKIKEIMSTVSNEVWGTWTKLILAVFATSMLLPNLFEVVASISSNAVHKASLFTIFLAVYFILPFNVIWIFYATQNNFLRYKKLANTILVTITISVSYFGVNSIDDVNGKFSIISKNDFEINDSINSNYEFYDFAIQLTTVYPQISTKTQTTHEDIKDHYNNLNNIALDTSCISNIDKQLKTFSNPAKLLPQFKQQIINNQTVHNNQIKRIIKKLQTLILVVNMILIIPALIIIGVYLKKTNIPTPLYIDISKKSKDLRQKTYLAIYLTTIAYLLYPVNRQLEPEMFQDFSPTTLFKLKNWNPIPQKQTISSPTTPKSLLWQISKDVKETNTNIDSLINLTNSTKLIAQETRTIVDTLPTNKTIKDIVLRNSGSDSIVQKETINALNKLGLLFKENDKLVKSNNSLIRANNSLVISSDSLSKENYSLISTLVNRINSLINSKTKNIGS